jgi:hypothetical protein
MLKPAILYKEQLTELFSSMALDSRYKYLYQTAYMDFSPTLENDTWKSIQLAICDSSKVIGYVSASLDRVSNVVTSIMFINFSSNSVVFVKDCWFFFDYLLTTMNFDKIKWSVIVGNPAEELYDRLCERFKGRIVGTFEKDCRLSDNKIYDVKHYEILRSVYLDLKA